MGPVGPKLIVYSQSVSTIVFNNIWSILLPCAQMLGRYVMKIPGVGG